MCGQKHAALGVLQISCSPGLADRLERAVTRNRKFVDVMRPGVKVVEFGDGLGATEIRLIDTPGHRHHDRQFHAEFQGDIGGKPVRALGQRRKQPQLAMRITRLNV